VAYTAQTTDTKTDKTISHVWKAAWDGSGKQQLTYGSASEHHPRFSADGRYLSFLSARNTKPEITQLWLMDRAGGEATRVTDFKGSLTDYAWSPDGKRVALVVQDEDPDAKTESGKTNDDKAPPPIVIDRFQFKDDDVGYLRGLRQHLYLLDLADRKSICLTPGEHNEYLPAWSPDGTTIAFVSKRGGDVDRHDNFDLYLIAPQNGATPRQLTTFKGGDGRPEFDSRPAWSPDGKSLAYIQSGPDELIFYAVHQLAVIAAAGGEPKLLTSELDRNVSKPRWSSDGTAILFVLEDDGNRHLAKVPAGGGKVDRILAGRRNATAFDVSRGGRLAVLAGGPERPAEILAIDSEPRAIASHNDELLHEIKLAAVDEFKFPSKDGTEIHGFVVKPPDYRPGTKYPTILSIHGGPVGQYANDFMPSWQLYAAHGYLVVGVNPRGSSGRGEAFSRAIFADWGNLDRDDVLAAIDHVVASGMADSARLGVGGWSYGGILTNYVIASDRRFKAAVSGSSSSNMLATYGTDMYVREYEAELGPPWKNPERWLKVSYPFLHADRIATPTLFLCGDKDFNVPLLNAEQMYQALRSLGVDTRLVIYPGQHHDISRPSYQRDRMERYLAWYGKYLASPAQ
jgi:dipeptidyl aminopeptidase/acylaminoacyl peptidase